MAKPYKRGRKYWVKLRWPEHPDADKEGRVRLPIASNMDEAKIEIAKLILQRDASRRGFTPFDTSWATFRKRYTEHLKTKASYPTRMAHNRAIKEIEANIFGLKDVRQVIPGAVEDIHTALLKRGLGKYIVVKIIKSIKALMRRAEVWQLTPAQDWKSIKTGKLPRGRVDYFTHDELKKLTEKLDSFWLTAVMLGAKVGLRPAEIYHLKKEDILIRDRKVIVREKPCDECSVKFHQRGLWTPKNHEKRAVHMTDEVADYLKHRMRHLKEDWLISEWSGWRPTFEGMTNTLGYKLKVVVGRGSAYILRHTYGTHRVQKGDKLLNIRDDMGHASITTTEIYLHA